MQAFQPGRAKGGGLARALHTPLLHWLDLQHASPAASLEPGARQRPQDRISSGRLHCSVRQLAQNSPPAQTWGSDSTSNS